jgi:hypothetical protein
MSAASLGMMPVIQDDEFIRALEAFIGPLESPTPVDPDFPPARSGLPRLEAGGRAGAGRIGNTAFFADKIRNADMLDELKALGFSFEGGVARGPDGKIVGARGAFDAGARGRGVAAALDYLDDEFDGTPMGRRAAKRARGLERFMGGGKKGIFNIPYPGKKAMGKGLAKLIGTRAATRAGMLGLGPLGLALGVPLLLKDIYDTGVSVANDPVADPMETFARMGAMEQSTEAAVTQGIADQVLEDMAGQAEAYSELAQLTNEASMGIGVSSELSDIIEGRTGALQAASQVATKNNLDTLLAGM